MDGDWDESNSSEPIFISINKAAQSHGIKILTAVTFDANTAPGSLIVVLDPVSRTKDNGYY